MGGGGGGGSGSCAWVALSELGQLDVGRGGEPLREAAVGHASAGRVAKERRETLLGQQVGSAEAPHAPH